METTPLDLLLLDAQYRQTLACLRVYGRAGLRVGAIVCQPEAWWAPTTRSRWCTKAFEVPDFTEQPDGYIDALLRIAKESSARLLVPAHDGAIQAIRRRRDELERHIAIGLAGEPALSIAVSKARTLALASELGIGIPRSIRLTGNEDVAAAVREIGLPAVIKPEQSWVARNGAGTRLGTEAVQTIDEAKAVLDHVLECGGEALIQAWLPGRREAVSLFYADGRMRARMAQVSHREWPLLGGVSVLCETIPLLPDITDASECLVRAMDLEGCSMVEFRRDRWGHPILMEVNPRMGGSVALAIAAGVNFPQLLLDWKLGRPLDDVTSYRLGQRLRWLPGDIWNLKCVFDSQGKPDVPQRSRAASAFFASFMRPANTIDVFERGDMKPGLAEMNRIVVHPTAERMRNSRPIKWLTSVGEVI